MAINLLLLCCKVAQRHTDLVNITILDDFSAEVAAGDGPEVLLVALAIARVLEEHVRSAGLNLRTDDVIPQLASWHHSTTSPFHLIPTEQHRNNRRFTAIIQVNLR